MNHQRRSFVYGCAALAALASQRAAWAAASDVSVHEREWFDTQREDGQGGRQVPVRLYWPEAALGAVPLVLFSHGFGSRRSDYGWLGQALARRGIATLHPQHQGSDWGVWMSGPPGWIGRELRGEGMSVDRLDRVADMRFVLDQLLASPWGGRIDTRRIAAAGHSLGAQTALLCGGAQLRSARGAARLRDPRVSAAVAIGIARFAGEADMAAVLRPVQVPTLHITTEEDKTSMPGYAATADDRAAFYRATGGPSGPAKALAIFQRGAHAVFADAGLEEPVVAASAELIHAFLRATWHAENQALNGWSERHRALVSRFERQGSMSRPVNGVSV